MGIAVFEEMFSILVFSLPHIVSVYEQEHQRSIKTLEEGKDYHNLLKLFLLILQYSLEDRFGGGFFVLGLVL